MSNSGLSNLRKMILVAIIFLLLGIFFVLYTLSLEKSREEVVFVQGTTVETTLAETTKITSTEEENANETTESVETENIISSNESTSATTEQPAETGAQIGIININTATKEELMTLSGIGEVKAESVISYREENGDFYAIEEIMDVSGIGEGTFNNIRDFITVG